MNARETAEKIVAEFDALELAEDEDVQPHIERLKERIATALAEAAKVPEGCVRDDPLEAAIEDVPGHPDHPKWKRWSLGTFNCSEHFASDHGGLTEGFSATVAIMGTIWSGYADTPAEALGRASDACRAALAARQGGANG